MPAARISALLHIRLATITDDGVLLPVNKKKKTDVQRDQRILWTEKLRAVVPTTVRLSKRIDRAID